MPGYSLVRLGVQSQRVVGRIMGKAFRLRLPLLADVLAWGESFQGLETSGEIVGHQEGNQMVTKLLMSIVVVAIDGGFLECSIHALDLAFCPRMVRFG